MTHSWSIPAGGAIVAVVLGPLVAVLPGGAEGPPCAQSAANCQDYGIDGIFKSDGAAFVAADDFRPASSGNITSICFWGAYAPDTATPPSDNFTIRYFNDSGSGLPDTLIDSFTGGELTVSGPVDTGDTTDGGFARIWEYTVTHPAVPVSSSGCYWISIVNPNDGSADWFWAHADSGEGNGWSIHDGYISDGFDFTDIEVGTDLAFCVNVGLGDGTQCGPPGICGSGGPCDVGPGPGCDDPACCAAVCSQKGLEICCLAFWDEALCIPAAEDLGCFDAVPTACQPEYYCQVTDLDFHGGGAQNAYIGACSDVASNCFTAENFTPAVSGNLNTICWWGFYFNLNQGAQCSAGAVDDFTITYYHDDGNGLPGSQIASFAVSAARTANGGIGTGGAIPVFRFEASHADVAVTAGACYWVEITNDLDGSCTWWWSTAPPGDRYSMTDGGDGYDIGDGGNHDLAWCANLPLGDQSPCAAPTPAESCDSAVQLTQSTDPDTITQDLSIACNNTQGGNPVWNLNTYYARSYDLGALSETAGSDQQVECVQFGVEINRGGANVVTVNLYQDTNGGAPSAPGSDLVLLGSSDVIVPASVEGALLIAEFDPPVDVAADTVLVVELYQPSRSPNVDGDSGIMVPGANSLGQSHPGYIRTADCNHPTYVTLSSVGAANMHLVQRVGLAGQGEPCPWDCSVADGIIGVDEFLAVLGQWGQVGASCDLGIGLPGVGVDEFLKILGVWGYCP